MNDDFSLEKSSIGISHFAKKQYNKNFKGLSLSQEDIKKILHLIRTKGKISNGYANFCKIVSFKNLNKGKYHFSHFFHNTISKVEAKNQKGIFFTDYESRQEDELPVLTEWVENIKTQTSPFINLILYSREQMIKENENHKEDWLIVSFKTSLTYEVEPMKPITAFRNALGIEQGGSGSPINKKEYLKSVYFWENHISIRNKT